MDSPTVNPSDPAQPAVPLPQSQSETPPAQRKPRARTRQKALAIIAAPAQIAARTEISLSHHEAHCTICSHPARHAIEQGFLHWQLPSALAYDFSLGDRRVVYRHARALGLFQQRAAKSRRVLEYIMEQAENATITAESVIRAVRAHACLGEDGRWTEPPKRMIVTHEYAGVTALAAQPTVGEVERSRPQPASPPRGGRNRRVANRRRARSKKNRVARQHS